MIPVVKLLKHAIQFWQRQERGKQQFPVGGENIKLSERERERERESAFVVSQQSV